MSTRGSFIVRKNNVDKELYIPHDAYPDNAGRDVVRMIKSLDLNMLYDLLVSEDEYNADYPTEDSPGQEPLDFSLPACVDAVRHGKKYIYKEMGHWFIQDSLFCEYGFVLDLDESELHFYTGFQRAPQKGNRYGCEPKEGYYPCHLRAVFPFKFVRQTETSEIVRLMKKVVDEDRDEIRGFVPGPDKAVIAAPDDATRSLNLSTYHWMRGLCPTKPHVCICTCFWRVSYH